MHVDAHEHQAIKKITKFDPEATFMKIPLWECKGIQINSRAHHSGCVWAFASLLGYLSLIYATDFTGIVRGGGFC